MRARSTLGARNWLLAHGLADGARKKCAGETSSALTSKLSLIVESEVCQ